MMRQLRMGLGFPKNVLQHGRYSKYLFRVHWRGWWNGKKEEAFELPPPQNWGITNPNPSHTSAPCVVLKAAANDKRKLTPCHNEFRGIRNSNATQEGKIAVKKVVEF
ncbi:hypothetical protein TNCV_3832242 [Trichonephila clavipes]|nr:hypothetical protein TNCV_3832242 [Trichonephila clavipes]